MKTNPNFLKFFIVLLFISQSLINQGQNKTAKFPDWKEGEMEIHHINTGSGESVFCLFPDGTNMLIDAGDLGTERDAVHTSTLPTDLKQPGEWIARYISRLLKYRNEKTIDYALLTHFHSDHIGKVIPESQKTKKGGDYYLTGMTEVAEYVPFKKLIDRDWPDYQFPSPMAGRKDFDNYKNFVDWNIQNSELKMETFMPGDNSQIELLYNAEKYPGFVVQNIYANGKLWTGENNETKNIIPENVKPDENRICAALKISYGKFDYFNGGDITGRISIKGDKWRDIETPLSKVLGPVEVCEANHHAYVDAMNETFIANTTPQVFVLQVWNARHTNLTTLRAMTSTELYPDKRLVLATNVHEFAKNYLGKNMNKIDGYGGHVVIKVKPGGDEYTIYLLSAEDESMKIKSVFGPIKCK